MRFKKKFFVKICARRILPSNKKDQSIENCNNLDGSHGHYAKWEKNDKIIGMVSELVVATG